jgi:leader peptidase (prepilin peptidase) / N-methyltransferase
MQWIFIVGFALIVGSFLNVVIHRLPHGHSLVRPGSKCPRCGTPIAPYDNVPVLSYLWLRGRCRSCGQAISALYPAVELLTAVLVSVVVLRFGLQPALVPYVLMTFLLIAVTVIDLQLQIIPDKITLPFTVVFLLGAVLGEFVPQLEWPISALGSVAGALVGGGIIFAIITAYYWATGKYGMGGGDLKYLAMVGALLGAKGVLLTLMLASFLGTAACIPLMVLGRVGRQSEVSFGPFLALGTFITMLFGDELIRLYQEMLGPAMTP